MTTVDDTIRRHGLPRHPHPTIIANHLRRLADTLDQHGPGAIRAASVLAARGYPSSTLGDGGASNGASILVDGERIPVTGTEAAAIEGLDGHTRWHDADRTLATLLRLTWSTNVRLEQLVSDLLAHADTIDELPAASGACEACGKIVRSDHHKTPEYLRAGLCNACRMHWDRSGITDRGDWLLTRRAMLRHREGAQALTQRFRQALTTGHLEAG